jgi:hypothetical protein
MGMFIKHRVGQCVYYLPWIVQFEERRHETVLVIVFDLIFGLRLSYNLYIVDRSIDSVLITTLTIHKYNGRLAKLLRRVRCRSKASEVRIEVV